MQGYMQAHKGIRAYMDVGEPGSVLEYDDQSDVGPPDPVPVPAPQAQRFIPGTIIPMAAANQQIAPPAPVPQQQDQPPPPPPGLQAYTDSDDPNFGTPPAPAPPNPYGASIDKMESAIDTKPKMKDPKWWQKALAVGFGGAAGFSNAGGGHGNTLIDIPGATEGIQHPGYAGQEAKWQANTMAPAQAHMELEGKRFEAQQKAALQVETIDHLKAQGEYYRGVGRNDNVPVTARLSQMSGGALQVGSTIGGQYAAKVIDDYIARTTKAPPRVAVTPMEKYKELKEAFPGRTDEELWQAVVNPTQVGKPAPAETAEAAKLKYQATVAKLSAEGMPVGALQDVKQLAMFARSSRVLTPEEKNGLMGYLAANTTPAATGTNAVIRMESYGQSREYPVINKNSGQLEMRSANEINKDPGTYAPAGAGAQAMSKEAIFSDLNYNIDNARKAIVGLGNVDAPTRAALAYVLRHTDPGSAMQSFFTSTVAANLTPAQQEAVQSLALLAENAMTLRTVGGMGAGSDQVRAAILATIPGPNTPSGPYAMGQLNKLQQVVDRLHKGNPGMGAAGKTETGPPPSPGRGGPQSQPEQPPANLLKEGVVTTFKTGSAWTLVDGQVHQVINGKVQ